MKVPLGSAESNGGSGLLDAHRCRLGIMTPAEGLIAPVKWLARGTSRQGLGYAAG